MSQRTLFVSTVPNEESESRERIRVELEQSFVVKLKTKHRKATGHVETSSGNWFVVYAYRPVDPKFGPMQFAQQTLDLLQPLWQFTFQAPEGLPAYGSHEEEKVLWCTYWLPTSQQQLDQRQFKDFYPLSVAPPVEDVSVA